MRKFEVGKRYYNESKREEKTVKIRDWGDREVFFTTGHETVEA